MLPFDYEQFEQIEDGVCIYHNVTMIECLHTIKKWEFFTHVEYCIDTTIISFYFLDSLEHAFYFIPEYVELEMA